MTNSPPAIAVDPSLTFRFIVSWAAPHGAMTRAAYVSKMSALTRETEAVIRRKGRAAQDVRGILGQTTYGELTLERGLTLDPGFDAWASEIWFYPNTSALGTELSGEIRRNLKIDLLNQAGRVVTTYYVFNCWPSAYTALPELDGPANGVAIESMTLQHEGWTREGPAAALVSLPSPDKHP